MNTSTAFAVIFVLALSVGSSSAAVQCWVCDGFLSDAAATACKANPLAIAAGTVTQLATCDQCQLDKTDTLRYKRACLAAGTTCTSSSTITCCNTNLCNGATSRRPAAIAAALALLVGVFYSL